MQHMLLLYTGTPAAASVMAGVHVLNDTIGVMVVGVLWVSPVGVASLIAASICSACSLSATAAALGLWMLTVLLGLLIMVRLCAPSLYVLAWCWLFITPYTSTTYIAAMHGACCQPTLCCREASCCLPRCGC